MRRTRQAADQRLHLGEQVEQTKFFAELPCISSAKLAELRDEDAFLSLKTLLGLAIAKGLYQERVRHDVADFASSISDLTRLCHLSRNQVVAGLKELQRRGVIARSARPKGALEPPRTAFYCFCGERPFIKVPYQHLQRVEFLKKMKRWNRSAQRAMEVYLRLGAIRNYRTGQVWVTYNTLIEELETTYAGIRLAFLSLMRCRVIDVFQPRSNDQRLHYTIVGVEVDPRSLEYARETAPRSSPFAAPSR